MVFRHGRVGWTSEPVSCGHSDRGNAPSHSGDQRVWDENVQMEINAKAVIKGGAVVGAIVAMAGAIHASYGYVHPYVQNTPPYAEDAALQVVAQTQQKQQSAQDQMQSTQVFLLQKLWENQVVEAQIAVRRNPNDALAQRQLIAAQQALAGIQRQLSGGK